MSALCLSDVSMAKDSYLAIEAPREGLAESLSISHWVSKVLLANLPIRPGSASGLSFLIDVRRAAANARIHATRRVAQVLKSKRVAAAVEGGRGEESGSGGGGLSSDAGKPEGKGSWNDMPKFLVAGAVSTVISRSRRPLSFCFTTVLAPCLLYFPNEKLCAGHALLRWRG